MEPVTSIMVNVYNVWLLSVVAGFGLVCGICVAYAVGEMGRWVWEVPGAFVRWWVRELVRWRPKPR
jgi:hypothetical protein